MTGGLRARVVIPTTVEPVSIISLKNDDGPSDRSIMCIGGTTTAAGIANDYNAFVRRATGVIARLFGGHEGYRLDVSDRVDVGSSWQFPVLLAHALHAKGRLSQENDTADVLVWATGTVRSLDLRVGEVGHVADKLRASRDPFARALAEGRRLQVFVARSNLNDVDPDVATWLTDRGVAIQPVDLIDEALAALDLPPPARAASASKAAPARWSGNPYRGLEAFDLSHRPIFFGRAKAREECVEKLRRAAARGRAFLLIHGRSGVGKSSLAQAGIAGDIVERAHEGGTFKVAVLIPQTTGAGPLAMLADALGRIAGREEGDREDLAQRLRGDHGAAVDAIEKDLRDRTPRASGLLVIDQLEQLFGETELHADTKVFARVLERLARRAMVWTIATIRTDQMGFLDHVSSLAQLASDERVYRLDRPSEADLLEIITAPAALAGLRFANASGRRSLPDTLTSIAWQSPDSLPLLQVMLSRMYEQADKQGVLTFEAYDRLGGFEGGVSQWANDAVETLSKGGIDEASIDRALVDLVRIDHDTGRGLARPVPLPEAASMEGDLLRQLAKCRLVTVDAEGGVKTARLAHEVLITHWPRLSGLIERLRALIELRDRLQAQADTWIKGSREAEDLIHGTRRLEEASELVRQTFLLVPNEVRALASASLAHADAQAQAAAQRVEAEQQREQQEQERRAQEAERRVADAQAIASANRRITQRTRAGLLVAVLLALAAAGFGAYATFERAVADKQTAKAELNRMEASKQRQDAEAAKRRAERNLERANHNLSGALTAVAQVIVANDPVMATKLALASWPREAGDNTRPKLAVAVAALGSAVSDLRERKVLRGHEKGVWSAAFSPDGTRVVTSSDDGTARLWEARTGKEIVVLRGHSGRLLSAEFSPEGTRVLTSFIDGARIWDATNGNQINVLLRGEGVIYSANFSPDGTRVLTTYGDGLALLWSSMTGKSIAVLRGHDNIRIIGAAFSPNGAHVVTGSDDGTARVWDTVAGKPTAVLRGHESGVRDVHFSPDSTQIVTASLDNTARVWNAATGKLIVVLRGHQGGVYIANFSPDGSRIVTAASDNTARLWDARTGRETAVLSGHQEEIRSAAFSHDGTLIVTASRDKTVRLWDAATGTLITVLHGHNGEVNSATFSPDDTLVVTASDDHTARLWDAAAVKPVTILRGNTHETASFSPDGTQIITVSTNDGEARLWDAASGKLVATLHKRQDGYTATFSPDRTRVVTYASFMDKIALILDAATGKQVTILRGHKDPITSVAFSSNGIRLVTTSEDRTARLWDAATGKEIVVLHGLEVGFSRAALSPDGTRVVTISDVQSDEHLVDDRTPRLWDAATGKEIAVLRGHEAGVVSAAFSPDGTRVVTASEDRTARLWDAATGKVIAVLRGHEKGVNGAAFSPDGTRVVTASDDTTVRLWDTASGGAIAIISGDENPLDIAAFSPDGTRIVTATRHLADSPAIIVRVWNVSRIPKGNLFQIACTWLPDTDLTNIIAADYGLTNLVPICQTDPPLPDPPLR